jgi:cyclohexanone monooxygenase
LRNKIAQIVKDPVKRAKVTPQDYYARRPICDSGYFETFNRDNVDVHDLKEDPIVEVLPEGVKTAQGKVYELDVLVFATGFNAVDGNYNRISFRNGESGPTLKQKWFENPQAYMGMFPAGFPNLIMLLGPGTGTSFLLSANQLDRFH